MARHIPGPLYFEQQGATGLPMVFTHSTPDDHRLWLHQTAHFSAWYRTIAIDLAGYGRSPAVQPGLAIADQAQACWEAVDRVTSGPVILQGNSIGSSVAMSMATQRPERALALIVSGTGYIKDRSMMRRWAERYRAEGIGLRHGQLLDHFSPEAQKTPLVQHYARMVDALNNEGTLASIVAMNEANAEPRPDAFYEDLRVPTLIISGSADRNHPTSFELQKRIRGSELVTIEGAGHATPFERPWEFDAHCIRFLAKLGLWCGPAQEKP
jgi:pimeloyl-ACP methyl ester carboxylesterase